jgi:hypothetical protein
MEFELVFPTVSTDRSFFLKVESFNHLFKNLLQVLVNKDSFFPNTVHQRHEIERVKKNLSNTERCKSAQNQKEKKQTSH